MIRFTILGTPVTKKNSQRIARDKNGRPFILQSAKYLMYQKICGKYLPYQWAMLEGPYNLRCVYYMPTRRRVDLCNLLAATCDILTHYGVLKDDNCRVVASHDGSRVDYDSERPRVEIELTEVPE